MSAGRHMPRRGGWWRRVRLGAVAALAAAGTSAAVAACGVPIGAFCADYYAGRTASGTVLASASTPAIAYQWGAGSPAPGVPADNFSGRWQGSFDFPAGTYRFSATADDGVRVLVDGVPVIDAYVMQSATTYERMHWLSGRHIVTVEYFDAYASAQLKVGWTRVRAADEPAPAPIGSNATSPLGSNLSDWRDWSTEQPFIDLFKTSRGWIPQAPGVWDTGERARLDLDADGWPRSLPAAGATDVRYRSVATLLLTGADLNATRPGGEYVVLHDGEGTLAYGLGARRIDARSRPGRDVVQVDAANAGGLLVAITATDPNRTGNHLRNIRVAAPGIVCDDAPLQMCLADNDPACQRAACRSMESALGSRLFHPDFLRAQVRYRALRFMGPQSANVLDAAAPQVTDWSQRNRLTSARWNDQAGVPPEVVFALSNQLRADAWVNMPHRASDDYMRQFARMARAQLDPSRRVVVEYGNEIWNTAFSAGTWVQQQAEALWPGGTDSGYTKRINWHGKRTAEMCDIWKAEWGADAGRVTCALGAQAANAWTATAALECRLWSAGRPCQAHGIGAVAIAPYAGSYLGLATHQTAVRGWTADADGGLGRLFAEFTAGGVLAGAPAGGALAQSRGWVAAHAAEARRRGLALLAYEGGQHLAGVGAVASDAAVTNLFVRANRDPRMTGAYLTLLSDWTAAGGGLFMHFQGVGAPGRYGSWGALEHMGQTRSAKFDALAQFIAAHPR